MGLNWSLVSINVNLNMWKIYLKSKHIIQVAQDRAGSLEVALNSGGIRTYSILPFPFFPLIFLFLPVD